MKIGLDFDNTIVSYETVFHKVAVEQGHIDPSVAQTKIAVRDDLRARDKEDIWTEMQGFVYGKCMDRVDLFDDVMNVLEWANAEGHEVFIVSHKTIHPYAGPKYDLHQAAREFIETALVKDGKHLVKPENINFRETKAEKVDRIAELECDIYLDDLPEILNAPNWPDSAQRVLFDPFNVHPDMENIKVVHSWQDFQKVLEK